EERAGNLEIADACRSGDRRPDDLPGQRQTVRRDGCPRSAGWRRPAGGVDRRTTSCRPRRTCRWRPWRQRPGRESVKGNGVVRGKEGCNHRDTELPQEMVWTYAAVAALCLCGYIPLSFGGFVKCRTSRQRVLPCFDVLVTAARIEQHDSFVGS